MDILTPATPPREHIVLAEVNKLILFNREMLQNLVINHTSAFNMVWRNPVCSPQEIFDLLGANAFKLFESSFAIQKLIKQIDPAYELLTPPVEYQVDPGTGRVIVTPTPAAGPDEAPKAPESIST